MRRKAGTFDEETTDAVPRDLCESSTTENEIHANQDTNREEGLGGNDCVAEANTLNVSNRNLVAVEICQAVVVIKQDSTPSLEKEQETCS